MTSETVPDGGAPAADVDLGVLRADAPGYRIWRESFPGRIRYVARSLQDGQHPHTVVTADLDELREALTPAQSATLVPFSTARPNIARMYAYFLQGKDHYPADRAAADAVAQQFPEVAQIAQANRAFLARAVQHVATQGVTQFIDVGAGLPTWPNTHEIARESAPGARVCYIDNDPVVLSHLRALSAVDNRVSVMAGDIRETDALLTDLTATRRIDPAAPVCVLLVSVLHFLRAAEADAAVAAFKRWMAPRSYLVVSAGTSTGTDPELIRCLQAAYGDTAPATARTAGEIAAWFDGFSLARPGLVDVWEWRPLGTARVRRPEVSRARFLAGVGRKAPATRGWQP
jgi:S-adenosyl methyltransferase